MLKSLAIQNVALIDRAEFSFSEGLNVLSGETGAGKSVILDSIDFVLGAKSDKGMIRHGETECTVRAEFSADDTLSDLLFELDIEPDETLVISRKLNLDGRGGIKVNGCPVSATMLRKLTSRLVDVHGQSDHFFLLKESNQLALVDKITGEPAAREKEALSDLLEERKKRMGEFELLGSDEGSRSRRMDILRFQIDEIERSAIREGEEEELLVLRNKYANAEKLLNGLHLAEEALLGEGGGTDLVNSAHRALNSLSKYADYSTLTDRLESALAELEDIGGTIEEELGGLDFDERDAERVENRLDEIRSLKKKYGGSEREIFSYLERAKEELNLLENSGERYEELSRELSALEKKLYQHCLSLSDSRKRAARDFTRRVSEELKTLNISSARFAIKFEDFTEDQIERVTHTGLDKIDFLFSANAGEPLKELDKIISGGEMSRLMLAIKAQGASETGTCIFDEIDAGIGGKTARVVAEKFCKIAKHTQVIAVSHLAWIAAHADRQFLIEKTEQEDRTYTRVKELSASERRDELARLISGESGELALKQADELLERAKIYKTSL